MRTVLVLGATGMLGHKVWQACEPRTETWAGVRTARTGPIPSGPRVLPGLSDVPAFEQAIERSGADVVVNCIGVIKQAPEAHDPEVSIAVNALLPHQLSRICATHDARLIQISTDCVFSGARGNYNEDDEPDPVDLYGRSKLLGEVTGGDALTLRTSIIGRELRGHRGLLEWFLAQRGRAVRGFDRARFSGLTTNALGRLIAEIAVGDRVIADGLWHVSAEPITKHELLLLVRAALELEVEVVSDDTLSVDRTLDSSRFRAAAEWSPPSWQAMLAELAADPTPYPAVLDDNAHG